MDFHSLTRKELQSLCKLNKIPANITNVAMADALQSLPIVVGIEEFMNASQSEVSDLVEVLSPNAPQTRCRTTTRPKAKTSEIETPAVSRTCRKAPATSTRRNVSYQLNNECEKEAKEEGHKYSTRRSTRLIEKKSTAKKGSEKAVKIGSFIDLTENEDDEVTLKLTGNSNAEVEDICNAFDELVVEEEVSQKSVEDNDEVNNLKKLNETTKSCEDEALEDKLETSEVKIDQVCEVKSESIGMLSPCEEATHESGENVEDCDEVNNLKQELDETTMSCEDNLETSEVKIDDVKPESDGEKDEDCDEVSSNLKHETAISCDEVGDLQDNLKTSAVENDLKLDSENITFPCEDVSLESEDGIKEHTQVMVQEDNFDCQFQSGVDAEFGHEDTLCADSEMNNQLPESNETSTMVIDDTKNPNDEITIEETADENTVDVDVIPTVDNHTTMTEEVEDYVDVIPTVDNHTTMTEEVEDHVHVIPTVDNHSTMTEEVEDHVDVIPTVDNHSNMTDVAEENNVNEKCDADFGLNEKPFIVVSDNKENFVDQGKHKKKEKDDMEKYQAAKEISIRQLKKQLKALTLKNNNSMVSEVDQEDATTRPALQTL